MVLNTVANIEPMVAVLPKACRGLAEKKGMSRSKPNPQRKFLGVMFECCRVYSRVYIDPAGEVYEGRCPRCRKSVRFVVGEGGSGKRMWRVR
jgi:hypothetical protein